MDLIESGRTVRNLFSTEFVFDESGGNINGFCLAEITLNKKTERKILHLCCGVPRNFVRGGGGSTNSVEDRENGDLGAVAP